MTVRYPPRFDEAAAAIRNALPLDCRGEFEQGYWLALAHDEIHPAARALSEYLRVWWPRARHAVGAWWAAGEQAVCPTAVPRVDRTFDAVRDTLHADYRARFLADYARASSQAAQAEALETWWMVAQVECAQPGARERLARINAAYDAGALPTVPYDPSDDEALAELLPPAE